MAIQHFPRILIGLLALLWSVQCRADRAGNLISEINDKAASVARELQQQGSRVVGVLKFEVRDQHRRSVRGDDTLSSECGDWLETALRRYASNGNLQIVKNASEVASKTAGANHRSEAGRQRLFAANYRLPDGKPAKVDTFVTGRIVVRQDLASVRVILQSVHDRRQRPLYSLDDFDANTKMCILNQLGVPYHLRDGGSADQVHLSALETLRDPERNHPAKRNPLISFEVFYDGTPVPPRIVDGMAVLPEPRQGQHVWLKLKRLDQSDRTFAAVVKVNGENVLWRKRLVDFAGPKYVLHKGDPAIMIKGFQKDDGQADAFQIASAQRSRELESVYGADVGTISITVFQQGEPEDTIAPELQSLAIGQADSESATITPDKYVTRGVIQAGSRVTTQRVRLVDPIPWDPTPVLSCVFHYYQPGDR
ncbi:hypothetical protein [Stieleria mannarensis]|uniref:hypothetical protein n=1 Tax=Stieleria mannarensis TaxID=2755585 RepID=UPI001600A0A5|nr:hypothetical protein [Rhodopirellula sp. JC639]